ncbi:MAG: amino acid adenylation domain-containing protein [Christensenellales bacterium]
MKNIIYYLKQNVLNFPEKTAFCDEHRKVTYSELYCESVKLASAIARRQFLKCPVAVFIDKSVECVAAYLGVIYSGNFYSPLDTSMPKSRINKILVTLDVKLIITDKKHLDEVKTFAPNIDIVVYEEAQLYEADTELPEKALAGVISSDIMYVLFTSGSTGIPKGAVISHGALMDFVDWAVDKYGFNDCTVFGNQVPFYFSMSIWDIFAAIRCAATCYIIPVDLFMFPIKLLQYLDDKKINTLVWVPSALCLVVNLKALPKHHVSSLKLILFGGEVMPVKKLNKWIEEYPAVKFVNIYGPTEVTDTFMAYLINRRFADGESLPIGELRSNHEIMILDENDCPVSFGETGELCVRGAGLARGYYNNPEQTKTAFVQNPLMTAYPDIVYRTGDLVKYNENGEIVYVARKDFQIKHMGRRIELGEIEVALSSLDGIDECCCLYDEERSKIAVFYTGELNENQIFEGLKKILPDYMIPGVKMRLSKMPHNLNGKIDRVKLKVLLKEGKYNERKN